MPSLKSSSKTGDTIALFATELRQIKGAMETLKWTKDHTTNPKLIEWCTTGCAGLLGVVQEIEKQAT